MVPLVLLIHATATIAHEKGLIVIIDGKRNDIGSTAEAYARGYLGKVPVAGSFEPSWQADAITVNPYLGSDGITPFVKVAAREHKGIFVLVRTSNSSAGDFQDLLFDGKPLYRHVGDRLPRRRKGTLAKRVTASWVQRGRDLSRATGRIARKPARDRFARPRLRHSGRLAQDVSAAFDENGMGALINNS